MPMTFWKKQNYGESKKVSGCHRLRGREGQIGRAQGILRAVKLVYDGITTDNACHCTPVHIQKVHNMKNEH